MTSSLRRFCVWVVILPLIVSCNVFAPFDSNGSENDHLEEGLACLNKGDNGCAAADYAKLPDGDTKFIGLCEIQLAQAGLTLDVLLNVLLDKDHQSTVLGNLAQALTPWSVDKANAVKSALLTCAQISSDHKTFGNLLSTLANFTDCGLRVSHADTCRCSSDSDAGTDNGDSNRKDPACSVTGNQNGRVEKADITIDNTTGVAPGICPSEISACIFDLATADGKDLGELKNVKDALDAVPPSLKDTNTLVDPGRALLTQQISN